MYYELYIDVLFLENLILDYLLLRLLKRVLNCSTTQLRLFFSAVLGSAGFCVLCGTSIFWTVPGLLISYLGISAFMVKIGLQIKGFQRLLFAVGMLYGLSLLLGGIVSWFQGLFPADVGYGWILFPPAFVLLELLLYMLFEGKKQKARFCQVTLLYGGVVKKTVGLWDTGNSLWDPLHQKPVSIVERKILEPEILQEELIFQIPYHSLGNTNGMLEALIGEYLSVQIDGETYVIERPVLGLTDESLSGDGSYHLILNPNLVNN